MNSTESLIKSVSECVYETLLVIETYHPDWFQRKYQNYPWSSREFKLKLLTKLEARLKETKDKDELIIRLISFLLNFLLPDFFASNYFRQILNKITCLDETGKHSITAFNHTNFSYLHEAFSVLLVDAENLNLTEKIEKIFYRISTHPLKIKIAVANWRKLGKKDEELTSRGYELFHVPPGKNNADFKLLSLGSSLFINYPLIQEVFICSSDGDLEYLSNLLHHQGIIVHTVSQQAEEIIITNLTDGKTCKFSLTSSLKIPTMQDFIARTKKIIIQEQQRTSQTWINIQRVFQLINQEFKVTISDIVNHHFPEQKNQDIFSVLKEDFVLHQASEKDRLYLTIFNEKNFVIPQVKVSKNYKNNQLTHKIESRKELEMVVVNISKELILKQNKEYVLMNEIASRFMREYQIPITRIIKELKLGKNFPDFLQSCHQLNLKKEDKIYKIGMSQVLPSEKLELTVKSNG